MGKEFSATCYFCKDSIRNENQLYANTEGLCHYECGEDDTGEEPRKIQISDLSAILNKIPIKKEEISR